MSVPKQLIVLVSSSQKEARFCENLLPRLQDYSGFSEKNYNFHPLPIYSIPSIHNGRSFLHPLLQRYQQQTETLARVLQKVPFWDDSLDHDPELTLVGFRQGCRLVKEFLLRCLNKDDNVRQIRRIRQVVFLSPLRSHWVAKLAIMLAVIALLSCPAYILWPGNTLVIAIMSTILALFTIVTRALSVSTSPQALKILGMDPEWYSGSRIDKEFEERIKRGSRRKIGTWPIPSRELWPSRVKHADPKVIQEISEAILEPSGHPNVYEIDLFEYTLTVKPVQSKDLPQEVQNKLALKEKYTSQAALSKQVHFAGHDQTGNEETRKTHGEILPWELHQGTRGYLEVQDPPPNNLATAQENFPKNSRFIYRFRPKPYEVHSLHVTIYGGYNTDNRNGHMHLRADANFQCIRENLDLSGYLSQGWNISEPKALFFHNPIPSTRIPHQPESLERSLKDLECDCLSRKRVLEHELLQVKQISPGFFSWEKLGVRNGGITAFEFNVSPPHLLKTLRTKLTHNVGALAQRPLPATV